MGTCSHVKCRSFTLNSRRNHAYTSFIFNLNKLACVIGCTSYVHDHCLEHSNSSRPMPEQSSHLINSCTVHIPTDPHLYPHRPPPLFIKTTTSIQTDYLYPYRPPPLSLQTTTTIPTDHYLYTQGWIWGGGGWGE